MLRLLGESSSEVEKYGADFMWTCPRGVVGIQRKAVADLVASLRGDRVQRELLQQEKLDQAIWLIEGDWDWRYDGSGRLVSEKLHYSFAEYQGFVMSIQNYGHWVVTTDDVSQTADYLVQAERWFQKTDHDSLLRRPKARVPQGIHILQHFDGISLTRAKAIYSYFGLVPLTWTVTREEMAKVPGIGKVTVEKMFKALQ
jgi:ERCC4-type nuclease